VLELLFFNRIIRRHIEIINLFGSKEKDLKAVRELEIELYKNIG